MSATNGDKARHHRQRIAKINRRQQLRAMRAELEAKPPAVKTPKAKKAKAKTTPSA